MNVKNRSLLSVLCAVILLALVSGAACSKPAGNGSATAAPAKTEAPASPENTAVPQATPAPGDDTAAPGPDGTGNNIGDIYTFGIYEQDNDASDGGEPIEWVILDKDGDSLLLISRYALDCKPFNDENAGSTWESSFLRAWLNGEFIDSAFNSAELELIKSITAAAGVNPKYDTPAGGDTTDKVFILSIEEVERYFADTGSSECGATEYAIAQGVSGRTGENGTCCWWLRSPGDANGYAAYVANGWGVTYSGENVTYGSHGVRPALWMTPAD